MKITGVIKNKLFLAVALNAAFFALTQLLFGLNYEMLDETIFAELTADNYYYLGNFSNYFLFAAIGTLQMLIYPLNAYVITAMLLGLAGMITISKIILERFGITTGTAIIVILNGFFAINHYATVSFTRLPALLCVAGLVCIQYNANKKRFIPGFIWGALLVIIGSMYRFHLFKLTVAIFIAYICLDALVNRINKGEGFNIKLMFTEIFEPKRFVCGIVLIALCCGTFALGSYVNKSAEGIEYFTEYTAARSAVWDYEIPAYEDCKDEYDTIGIDANDLEMLYGHYMDDEGAFTLEKLEQINEIKLSHNAKRSLLTIAKTTVKEELFEVTHLTFKAILYMSVLAVTAVFIAVMKNKYLIIPAALYGVAGVMYIYLYYFGRVPYRAVYGIWLSIIIYLIYSLDSKKFREKISLSKLIKNKRITAVLLAFSVLVTGGFLYANNYRNFKNDFRKMQSDRAEINEYIKSHPDDKFELCRQANLLEGNLDNSSVYFINNGGRHGNSHIFNGTYYALPYYDSFNKDVFGTDNLYENLFNENVYYVDYAGRFKEIFKDYLEKYYSGGKRVKYRVKDKVDGFEIIDFYVE